MAHYDDSLTLRDARACYFAASGFDERSYAERWVKLQAGPIRLGFPNTGSRVRAVRFHDLHHVLTGYDTTWTGEGEIAAFEIASSCADHWAAWYLNLSAMAIGLFIAPGAMLRAFLCGRRGKNLYRERFDDALLEARVGETRRRLRLDAPPGAATAGDRAAFTLWSLAALASMLVTAALLLAPVMILLSLLGV